MQSLSPPSGKVAWLCTYIPEELIRGAGFLPVRPLVAGEFAGSAGYLPANLCPCVRQTAHMLLERDMDKFESIVLANSCNAMMHLYNLLKEDAEVPVFLLDLPRQGDNRAKEYFASRLDLMADFLSDIGGNLSEKNLEAAIEIYMNTGEIFRDFFAGSFDDTSSIVNFLPGIIPHEFNLKALSSKREDINAELRDKILPKLFHEIEFVEGKAEEGKIDAENKLCILTGAQPHSEMTEILQENGVLTFHDHCQGYRYWQKNYSDIERGDLKSAKSREDFLNILAAIYLDKPPCPRQYDRQDRQYDKPGTKPGRIGFYRRLLQDLDAEGVIYHNLNFCDFAHYDYLNLQPVFEEVDLPVLNLASELSRGDSGQIRTRMEAFLEMI